MNDEPTKSDLKRIDRMTDEDIDYSDIPEVDAAFFRTARVMVPPAKQQVTIRLDSDVLARLRSQGRGYLLPLARARRTGPRWCVGAKGCGSYEPACLE